MLIDEYRTSLISAAVTGRIDVHDIPIPEYTYIDDEADAEDEESFDEEV